MKRVLVSLAIFCLPLVAGAQMRESLLTPHGALFTVSKQPRAVDEEGNAVGGYHLVLKSQHGDVTTNEVVPATQDRESHTEPAMAYEPDSRTLYVFWIRHLGIMGSELMVSSRNDDGTWTKATAFGEQFDHRENLRIAVTRKVAEEDGTTSVTPAVSIHLAWWEYDSEDGHEGAHYAMVTVVDNRILVDPSLKLADFIRQPEFEIPEAGPDGVELVPPVIDRNLLKQPMLFSSARQDSVEIIFGDFETNRLHQVNIQPTKKITADGRLRVPVGRVGVGPVAKAPTLVAGDSRVEGVFGNANRIALYALDAKQIRYVIMNDGVWSNPQTISLDEQLTSGAAIDALRRLVNEH